MGRKKESRLQKTQIEVQAAVNKTNEAILDLGKNTHQLYVELSIIQRLFDKIRNVPVDETEAYESCKRIRAKWKEQADQIEKDYDLAAKKAAGTGAAGVGVGVAVAALGPTAAMGVATTFGVASTGTAIAALHGAAATNAALAWLGGGALAAGGGGIAAGNAFLALAGPIGWAIAGVAVVASGLMFWKGKDDIKHIESIFELVGTRDIKTYELAVVEINERVLRIRDAVSLIRDAADNIMDFGFDYKTMTEEQQYQLGAYVNLMLSSTQLLVNPILGLQPYYSANDFDKYLLWDGREAEENLLVEQKDLIIALSNLFYKISISQKERILLWKVFRNNKDFLDCFSVEKKQFTLPIMDAVSEALGFREGDAVNDDSTGIEQPEHREAEEQLPTDEGNKAASDEPSPEDGKGNIRATVERVIETAHKAISKEKLSIPSDYKQQKKPVGAKLPKGAVLYAKRTDAASALLMCCAVTEQEAMPFDNDQAIIDSLHEQMDDNEGLIAVGSGFTANGLPYVYNIIKHHMLGASGEPIGNEYTLNLNVKMEKTIQFINGSFAEEGTTGVRDSTVYAMFRMKNPVDENDPFAGWFCDPYDPDYKKGFLMNLSERSELDEMFPDHPLSKARSFVRYIAENN